MKITKKQLRRIIREAEGSTKKYDDDSALKGGQSKLPDALQKGIIDKTVDDREEHEEEKNESDARRQLRRIIGEARQPMPSSRLSTGTVTSQWSPSGLTMHLKVDGASVIDLSFKSDALKLITLLQELLDGPMRWSD